MTSLNNTSPTTPSGDELTGLHSVDQQTTSTTGNKSLKGHYGPHPHQDHPSAYVAAKSGYTSRNLTPNYRDNQPSRTANDYSTASDGTAAGTRHQARSTSAVESPESGPGSMDASGSFDYQPHPHAGKAAQSAHVFKYINLSEGEPNANATDYEEHRKPLQFLSGPVFTGSAQQPPPTDLNPQPSNEHDEEASRKIRLASQMAKHSATFAHQTPEPQPATESELPHRMAASQLVHNISLQGSSSLKPKESSYEVSPPVNLNSLAAASYAASHSRPYDESSAPPTVEQQKSSYDDGRVRNMHMFSASGNNALRDRTQQDMVAHGNRDDAFANFSKSNILNNAPGYQGSRASASINTKNVSNERHSKPIYFSPGSGAVTSPYQQKPKEPSYDFSAASAALRRHRTTDVNTSRDQTFESQEDSRARAFIRQMRFPSSSPIATSGPGNDPGYPNISGTEREQIQSEAIQRVRDMNLDLSKIQNRTDSQIRAYRPRSSADYKSVGQSVHPPHTGASSSYTPHSQRRFSQTGQFPNNEGEIPENGSDGINPVGMQAAAQRSNRNSMAAVPRRTGVASNDVDVEALQRRISRAYIDHEREEAYAIDLGAGRLISPEELESIARRNVDPMVSELAERATQENQRKQEANEAKNAKKLAKEEKRQKKRDEKARKAEEKRLAKERAKFAKQMSKEAGKTDEAAPTVIADQEQGSTSSEVSFGEQEQEDQSFDPTTQEFLIQKTDIANATKQQEMSSTERGAEEEVQQPTRAELSGATERDLNANVPDQYLHDEANELDGIGRPPVSTVESNESDLQRRNEAAYTTSPNGQFTDSNQFPVVQETVIMYDGQEQAVSPNLDEVTEAPMFDDAGEYKRDVSQKDDLDESAKVLNKNSPKSPVAWLKKKLKNHKDKAAVKRMLEEDSSKRLSENEKVHVSALQRDVSPIGDGMTPAAENEQRPPVVETHYEPGSVMKKTEGEMPAVVDAQPHVNVSSVPQTNGGVEEALDEAAVSKTDEYPVENGNFEQKKENTGEEKEESSNQVVGHFPIPGKEPIGAAFHEDL
ncbi:fungal protein [Schizosaccharomyces cryophilus OY26]|uniref:Fungal protein n=1 Tax=Schizosaccharomyces cryophilus (strain OY26 / ATCC MYA-4695 / CBS 11777 / NBRC 106824 / NRRL Y48691) TaxID=653667 RepID=S9VP89_SCHCR|nr:uncharacterized protein SPOG_03277 [Schizosaccharomyces cryophilus OY26]EPY49803.1 fungal protein [Schizosaccharomyces cryophilus OY26]